MRWAGLVESIGGSRGAYRVWWRNQKVRDQLEDPGVGGRIVLRSIFIEWNGHGLD